MDLNGTKLSAWLELRISTPLIMGAAVEEFFRSMESNSVELEPILWNDAQTLPVVISVRFYDTEQLPSLENLLGKLKMLLQIDEYMIFTWRTALEISGDYANAWIAISRNGIMIMKDTAIMDEAHKLVQLSASGEMENEAEPGEHQLATC